MPKIIIHRKSNYFYSIRGINVRINDIECGQISNGQIMYFDAKKGNNSIFLHMKGAKSNLLNVNVSDKDIHVTAQLSKFDIWTSFSSIILVPVIIVFGGFSNYFNLLLILGVFLAVYYLVRSLLKVTAFELREES